MGVHIIPYKFEGIDDESCDIVEWLRNEFDSLRMAGDTDFIDENKWEYLGVDEEFRRPLDIDKTIQWCEKSRFQQRFIPYLERMKTDKTLTFRFAY